MVFQNNLLMGAASAATTGFSVDDSCIFNDDDSANLEITGLSDGSSATQATFSCWFKRGNIGLSAIATIFSAKDTTSSDDANLYITTADKLELYADEADGGTVTQWNASSVLLRDSNAWYHLVFQIDTTQAVSGNRYTIWLNGVDISSTFTQANTIEQNGSTPWNAPDQMKISENSNAAIRYFDGYMSQVAFLDGQVLEATSFGEFDDYGVWRPINITGLTYTGNNSFLLDFADSSDLGNDVSGNNNDFTSSGLAATDQVSDTPTNNKGTWSPISHSLESGFPTLSNGNLDIGASGAPDWGLTGTFSVQGSGKYYWEYELTSGSGGTPAQLIGMASQPYEWDASLGSLAGGFRGYYTTGVKQTGGTTSSYGDSWAVGDRMGVAVDLDNGAIYFAKNNTWQDSGDPTSGASKTGAAFTDLTSGSWVPFMYAGGNRGSTGYFNEDVFEYTPPTSFVPLATASLPTPTILDPTENNQTTLYAGTGAVQTIGQASNSYFNKYGSGNRTTIISDSTSGGTFYGYVQGEIVNGNVDSGDGFGITSYATNMYIKFQFDEAVNITEVMMYYQATGGNLGDSWLWEGSNNDSDYTTLSGTIDLSSTVRVDVHSLSEIGASDTYLYYRIRNTNGNGANSTFWDEAQFKVKTLTDARGTFQPDFVWIKNRSEADDNMLVDAARGATKELNSNSTAAESTDSNGLTAFASSGFTLGTGAGGYNDAGEYFTSWQWLAGGGAGSSNEDGEINTTTTTVNTTAAGFSISTYTGTGAGSTIGHGLGAIPELIIIHRLDAGNNWAVYHGSNTSAPETDWLALDETVATADNHTLWNDTAPTSSVFSVGTGLMVNGNTATYVAYVWTSITGYSLFKSYNGNGNADGAVVYTGFKPAWVMIKRSDSTGDWIIYDSKRSPYNEIDDQLCANLDTAETTGSEEVDFLSNGFKIRTSDAYINADGGLYVYAAFASNPFGGADTTPGLAF